MLKQVLTTLQSLGVQEAPSNPALDLQPEPMDTSNVEEMDISNEDQNEMPKWGGMVSPSPEESGWHKHPDHKTSPNKQDFYQDE